MTISIPSLPCNDGSRIPQLGFGVFQVPPEETVSAVTYALEAGYRAVDTAAAYGNEAGVGDAIRRSGLPREDVYVTTKVWNSDHGRDRAWSAAERSLEQLGFDYVDLLLIHWPVPSRDLYAETWEALVALRADGRARSIGVSNFGPEHLERIIAATGEVPAVNQVELHPRLQQPRLREFHARHGIVTEAWSPLARGGELLDDPTIAEVATAHGRTPAQVILRWHIQVGNVVIPKSVTPERIVENSRIFDFDLTAPEMDAIAGLDRGKRIGPNPTTFAAA